MVPNGEELFFGGCGLAICLCINVKMRHCDAYVGLCNEPKITCNVIEDPYKIPHGSKAVGNEEFANYSKALEGFMDLCGLHCFFSSSIAQNEREEMIPIS